MLRSRFSHPALRHELRQAAIVLGLLVVLALVAWLPNAAVTVGR
jgi:hypothetical protein